MNSREARTVILTGATGFVGASLLGDILATTPTDVVCPVRATNTDEAAARLRRALDRQGVWQPAYATRIRPVVADLSQPRLGLSSAAFGFLRDHADVVYHCGAIVNLFAPYHRLRQTNVGGTQEVLRLAAGRGCAFHHVSTIMVFGARSFSATSAAGEDFAIDVSPKDLEGYAQTKLEAERLVLDAVRAGLSASIYRLGRITGQSETGVCNPNDALSLMVAGSIRLGVAPALEAVIHMTPVDIATRAILELSRLEASGRAFHLMNPTPVSWAEIVTVLRERGHIGETVPLDQWKLLLREAQRRCHDPVLDHVSVIISRSKPPFSSARRIVRDEQARCGSPRLRYPVDQKSLIERYAAYLAQSCRAAVSS